MTKTCAACNQTLSIESFGVDKRYNTRRGTCNKCRTKTNRDLRTKNPDKYRQYQKDYYNKNRAELLDKSTKHRNIRRASRPLWVKWSDLNQVYEQARKLTAESGVRHVVDHIIPLQNPHVCGLDVSWNLQVMTFEQNANKNNQWVTWW